MLDKETMEMCELAMRKLKADLHVMANALETGNAKLLLAASLDLSTGGEFFSDTIVIRMVSDEELIEMETATDDHSAQVFNDYREAIRAVDPVLADQWESIV